MHAYRHDPISMLMIRLATQSDQSSPNRHGRILTSTRPYVMRRIMMPMMKGLANFCFLKFRLIFEPQLEDPRISVLFLYFHLPVTARRQRTTLPLGNPSLPISWRLTYTASIDICKNQFFSAESTN